MQSKTLGVLLCTALAVAAIGLAAPLRSADEDANRRSWEYLTVLGTGEEPPDLNKLGGQRWELVHVEGRFPQPARIDDGGVTRLTTRIFYFKRLK